jgi:hypothetical protein
MPFRGALYAIAGDNSFVVYNRGLNFIFPIVGFLHGANLLDDDVRVPFHGSDPSCTVIVICGSSPHHLSTLAE